MLRAGIFKESMGARNRGGRGLSYRPARIYIGWRNSFLGIDSGAPFTFKNTGSGVLLLRPSNFLLVSWEVKMYCRMRREGSEGLKIVGNFSLDSQVNLSFNMSRMKSVSSVKIRTSILRKARNAFEDQ
jgi:hypothetical protein